MPDTYDLSEREEEILSLMTEGASNKEIAQQLFISPNTVKVHVRNIFGKLGVTSRTEAATLALRLGLAGKEPLPESNIDLSAPEPPVNRWVIGIGLILILLVFVFAAIAFNAQVNGNAGEDPVSEQAPPTWVSHTNIPSPRENMAAVSHNDRIYLIGGETADGVTDSMISYDPHSELWELLNPLLLPVTDVQGGVIGGKIYVPGGRTGSGGLTDALAIYEPEEDAWSEGAALPVPLSAYGLSIFEGKLYVFGGWDGNAFVDTVYEYSPDLDEWNVKTQMPAPRGYLGAVAAGGRIYVIGGVGPDGVTDENSHYTPSLDGTNQPAWGEAAPIPDHRQKMGVAGVAGIIYVVGGESKDGDALAPLQYFHQQDSWERPPALPETENWTGLSLVPWGTNIFALGGREGDVLSDKNQSYIAVFTIAIPIYR